VTIRASHSGEDQGAEDLLRELAPQVLGALARQEGDFEACEDAVQEALLDAAVQWPGQDVPRNPRGWLLAVARRRLIDARRSEAARRRRERDQFIRVPADAHVSAAADDDTSAATARDDTLALMLLCCHAELSPPSQIALTLRAVGGMTTAEIARAFLVPEPVMAQRITRAKQRIRSAGIAFRMPTPEERPGRLAAVMHVLYLIFTEGHTSSGGPPLRRDDLSREAIRLARLLRTLLPDDGEAAGLLALMLLTDARRDARTDSLGALVPLAEQDRGQWDACQIAEGIKLITSILGSVPAGPYQIQAAIAAVHAEAPTAGQTDWPQILRLYEVLLDLSPNPVTRLSYAVAVAMVNGPRQRSPSSVSSSRRDGCAPRTVSTRSAPTSSRWQATPAPPPATATPRGTRRASPNSATWRTGRLASGHVYRTRPCALFLGLWPTRRGARRPC
jgi:RNA polymerase sigma factor (sigma-70 family)